MQKRKIVSAMMGTAIAMVNLSSAAVPVYAKSNFIFPTVSITTKTDEEIETKKESIIVEADDAKQEEHVVIEKKNMEKSENDTSNEKLLDNPTLEATEDEEAAIVNEVEEDVEEVVIYEETKLTEETINPDISLQDDIAENKDIIDVESKPVNDSEVEENKDLPQEESLVDVELNHNICQIQHVNIEDCPIYDYPSEDLGCAIEYLPIKTNLFVIGDTINDFYSVSYNDEIYYVRKDNVINVCAEDFEEVESRTVYLNQKTNILNFQEDQSNLFLAEDLTINTSLEVVGKYELGYVKVLFNEDMGYIAEEYCSDTRITPQTSETQLKIVEKASDSETALCELGYCAAWVARVYKAAGLYGDRTMGNAIDFWTKWGINDGVTSSTRYDNIPVGAVVVGSGSGGDLGNAYGHVGIYLGDGMVAENVGKHSIVTLERWMEKNIGICDGYRGYIGWVFPFNIDLQEYPTNEQESLEQLEIEEAESESEVKIVEDVELSESKIVIEENTIELTEQVEETASNEE